MSSDVDESSGVVGSKDVGETSVVASVVADSISIASFVALGAVCTVSALAKVVSSLSVKTVVAIRDLTLFG